MKRKQKAQKHFPPYIMLNGRASSSVSNSDFNKKFQDFIEQLVKKIMCLVFFKEGNDSEKLTKSEYYLDCSKLIK